MEILFRIYDFIEYLVNYKNNVEELESLDRDYDILRAKYAKKKSELEDTKKEVEYLTERQTKNLQTIRKLRKELKGLKNDKEI